MKESVKNGVFSVCAATLAVALVGIGCSKPHMRAQEQTAPPVAVSSAPPASLPSTQVTEASLRVSEFMPVADVKTIYFAFDKSDLNAAARTTLRANADYLKAHPGAKVRVSGYCDPRGTVEYNLALGQRRAQSVRDYYRRLGVPGDSIATISYGKSELACSDASESCYAKCRRALSDVALPASGAQAATPAP